MKRPLCCLSFSLLSITVFCHFFGILPSLVLSFMLCGGVLCFSVFRKELKKIFLFFIILTLLVCTVRMNKTENATKILENNIVDVTITVYEADEKAKSTKVTAKGIIAFKENIYEFGEMKFYLRGHNFKAGDTVSFKAIFNKKNRTGLLLEPRFLNINSIKAENYTLHKVYGFFGKMRAGLSNEALDLTYGEETRLFPALLTGDKSYLTLNQRKIITNGGISHLVAVSGMHLAILVSFLSAFIRNRGLKFRFLIKNLACFFIAGVSGFSPSVMRAWAMFFILSFGELVERKADTVTSLGAFAIIMCLFFPEWLFKLATWLSVFAVLGIALFSDSLVSFFKSVFKFKKQGIAEKLFELLAISLSANLATMPIIALSFGYFPFWSVVTNLFLMGYVGIMLVLLWVLVGASLLLNLKVEFLCRLLATAARTIFKVAEFFGNLPPKFIGIDENYLKLFLIISVVTLLFFAAAGVLGKRLLFSFLMFFGCCFFMVSLNTYLNFDKAEIILTKQGCSVIVRGQKAIMLGNIEDSYERYQLGNALKRLNVHKIESVILDSEDVPNISLYKFMKEFNCNIVLGEGVSYRAFCKWGNWKELKLKENTIYPLGIKCQKKDSKIIFFFKGASLIKTMGKCDIIMEDCKIRKLQNDIFCTKLCIGEINEDK